MRRVLGVLAALCVLALVACSGDDDTGGSSGSDGATTTTDDGLEPQDGGVLRFGLAAETGGWNPAQDSFNLSSYQVAQAVYDRLVAYDEDDHWKPYLAESIEPNDDFTEWTFTLRPDIVFHDGTPLDADVLALNFQQTKDSPLLGQVFQAVEEITVVDPLTVLVTMNTPWSSFPHTLTAQPGLVVAPSVFEEGGNDTPVGTGPFVFDEWVRDNHLTVSRNEDYWREGLPHLDGIEFRVLADSASRQAAMESGDLDMAEIRDAPEVVRFEGDDSYRVYLDEHGETTESALGLNMAVPPFDDPLAREAVAYGIDRQTLSDTLFEGRDTPANGPFKESSPWYQGVEFPSYDPERAAAAAQAYEDANGQPISFEFSITTDPVLREVASLIQQQLGQLGIDVQLKTIEGTQAILDSLGGNFQMNITDALWGSTHPDREYTFIWGANALDPPALATNFTRVRNDDIDAGLTAARMTDDPEEQSAAWGQVQRGLAEENSYVYLVHVDVGTVGTPQVHDVTTWEFPDGTPGLPQEQNVVSLSQIWMES